MTTATTTLEPLGSLSPEAQRAFAEIGPIWGSNILKHADVVRDAYTPILAAADKSRIDVQRDLPYGSHPRQVVDVFSPEGVTNGDVVLFVHGGAYVRGAKRTNDEIFDNVLYWFARHGVVGVNVEYRLATDAPYPGGAEDVGLATEWAAKNIARFGGNPKRLFVIGHSAGATHVAGFAYDPAAPVKPGPGVAGIVTVSGRLRADALPDNPNAKGVQAYFGQDQSLYEERSPLVHAHRTQIPIFVAIAEFENPYLDVYGAEFYHKLSVARRHAPRFLRLRKHNHVSMMAHFNSGEELLGREILDFMQTGR